MTYLCQGAKYIVTFDPLDGSSIIDTNGAVGSIFAVWERQEGQESLDGFTGKQIVGSALCCYGSRTSIVVYNAIKERVDELSLQKFEDKLMWVISKTDLRIRPQGRYFSPGNGKSIKQNKGYNECITYWARNGYTLRYSGGMAPDCYLLFAKGEGVFSSVSSPPSVQSKLRLLYEVYPISHLIVKAGGLASNGKAPIMDTVVSGFTQKSDIIVGSIEEVERCDRFLSHA
jgi:sedoheptulose-bisphosphatase